MTTAIDLYFPDNPKKFHTWLTEQLKNGSTQKVILKQVLKVRSELALLRAAQICGLMGDYDNWQEFAREATKGSDVVIRLAAVVELTIHEIELNRVTNPTIFEMLSSTLVYYLKRLEEISENTEFRCEIELRVCLCLADIFIQSRSYKTAYEYASRAIILAKEIKLESLKFVAYSSLALISLRSGQLNDALENYENILMSHEASKAIKHFSVVNHAIITDLLGDSTKALSDLQNHLLEYPINNIANTVCQYIKATIGYISMSDHVLENASDSHLTQTKCLQLLLSDLGTSNQANLNTILSLLRNWKPTSPIAEQMVKWIQGLAYFRLKMSSMAARVVGSTNSDIPVISCLFDSLKLEISLSFEGIYIENISAIVSRIETQFLSCQNTQAREGLAARIAFWHPTAAAFLAFSPILVPELHAFGARSVFKDGRPIRIYDKPVSTRLPFVQKTLEVFGFNPEISRDQSVEQERLNKVLLVDWGDRKHLLTITPPALIAFHLFSVGESCGAEWKYSAFELIDSYGLVPTTMGGNLRPERLYLQKLLETLFAEKITTEKFRKELKTYQKSAP